MHASGHENACKIETNEELWLTGLHLEQYKHPTGPRSLLSRSAAPRSGRYPLQRGLRRVALPQGRYDRAIPYLERAVNRVTMQNLTRKTVKDCHHWASCCASWDAMRRRCGCSSAPPGEYPVEGCRVGVCAEIECAAGEYGAAMADLDEALAVNARSLKTRALKAALLQKAGKLEEAEEICRRSLEFDPLDPYAAVLTGRTAPFVKVVTGIDAAELFLRAGMKDLALRALELCGQRTVMRCAYAPATEDEKWLEEARKAPFDEVFPNREMDFTVLEKLEAADEANAAAPLSAGLHALRAL